MGANHLEPGTKAPAFKAKDQDGNSVALKDLKGSKIILFFYPKDMTSGCTKEACSFRDEFEVFRKKNAVILGVSKDSTKSHRKFVDKYTLPFTLLADPSKEMIKAYGSWKPKKFMGREFLGIVRSTFVLDEKGKILKIFPKVKVAGHSQEILNLL